MARPRKEITQHNLRQIEQLAAYGLTEAAIATVIGVDPKTLYRRKKDHAAVLSALEKGQAVAKASVGKALFQKASAGDLGAIIWWEKTRGGRRETQAPATEYAFNPRDFSDVGLERIAAGEDPVHVLATGGRASANGAA
jgi:hypothetical protein